MIAGIVLAAGRSRRMGSPKAFLRLGGETFLERTVAALRDGGCGTVTVVTGPVDSDVPRAIAEAALRLDARVVMNMVRGSEQVDSLRAGLLAVGDDGDAEAAMVTPVDVPGVSAEVVRAVADAFRATAAPIVQPYDGARHGHPVLFARALWPEFDGDLPDGARTVIHAHAAERAEVRVTRLAVDVDTPDDYRRLLEAAE